VSRLLNPNIGSRGSVGSRSSLVAKVALLSTEALKFQASPLVTIAS